MSARHCVRLNHRGLPKAVVQRKEKKGETVMFTEGEGISCVFKWCNKRPVTMLSLFHNAVETQVKTNYLGNAVIKPVVVDNYNKTIQQL